MRIGLYLISLLLLTTLFGCEKSKPTGNVIYTPPTSTTKAPPAADTTKPTRPKIFYADTFYANRDDSTGWVKHWIDTTKVGNEKQVFAEILEPGDFYALEIEDELVSVPWYGLFKNPKGQNYIKSTKIKVTLNGDIHSDEATKTITTDNKDVCVVLIGCLNTIREGVVKQVSIGQDIELNDVTPFLMNGNEYRLEATSEKFATKFLSYKVYLVGTKNGKEIKQLLLAKPVIETFARIQWVGDLDGDGLLDLVLDTGCKDFVGQVTVYLSSFAGDGELVKLAGFKDTKD